MRRRVLIAAVAAVAAGLGHGPARAEDPFLTFDFTCVRTFVLGESGSPERAAECARLCATYESLGCGVPSQTDAYQCATDPRASEGEPYDYCRGVRMTWCFYDPRYC